jgi:signal recognition particle receptor subunit alpha
MLISFTILHKGGLVLYHHSPEGVDDNDNSIINTWVSQVYLNPTQSLTDRKVTIDSSGSSSSSSSSGGGGITCMKQIVEWHDEKSYVGLAVYPDLLRGLENPWIGPLLKSMLHEFRVFVSTQQHDTGTVNSLPEPLDTSMFDKTFQLLLKKFKNSDSSVGTNTTTSNGSRTTNSKDTKVKAKKGGKEKRQWHDGKAKVTKEAMAELDFSKTAGGGDDDNDDGNQEDRDAMALAEARAAYLPSDADLADFELEPTGTLEDDDDTADDASSWGGSLKSLFQQVTGQKVLTKQDLQEPLKQMHNMLTSKNVAADIAQHICENVESSLVGKKLSSMYRVKTAVRQALERAINKLLLPSSQLDLLRQVTSKRDALFGKKRPYVIVVVGINGVGKSTSLAKLAFFLKTNGCKPLLAACDTFRSGAVEQLSVHAKCLDLPLFHQGYSKDPSQVAKAAIELASKEGNDVVLVDTAGRMQNNVPLMKALGKLAADNQPDLVVFVGEALVGNDGVDQVRMFNQAVNAQSRNQKVNAILLTKFDTVSDKVGAALTMTHVTNAPILFVGTGQKYFIVRPASNG